jgi:hypothetical protein
MVTVAQFHTHLEAARVALGTADYATAEREAVQAQVCLIGLPDGAHGADTEVKWRDGVDKLLMEIRRLRRETDSLVAGGIQRTKVRYVRAT